LRVVDQPHPHLSLDRRKSGSDRSAGVKEEPSEKRLHVLME
jgi:hypothetical protein